MSNPGPSQSESRSTLSNSTVDSPRLRMLRRDINQRQKTITERQVAWSKQTNDTDELARRQELHDKLQKLREEEAEEVQKLHMEQDMKKLSLAAKGPVEPKDTAGASSSVSDKAVSQKTDPQKAASQIRRVQWREFSLEERKISQDLMASVRRCDRDVRARSPLQVAVYEISEAEVETLTASTVVPATSPAPTASKASNSSRSIAQPAASARVLSYCACVQTQESMTPVGARCRGDMKDTRLEALRSLDMVLQAKVGARGQQGR